MASNFYAGIGSRYTPPIILSLMEDIAKRLAAKGMILRSGGAIGADTAFERGADYWYTYLQQAPIPMPKEIFYANDIDNNGFNGLQALTEAHKYHPAWDRLNPFVKKLHARNVFQIFGSNFNTPVLFVICWTRDGCIHHESRTMYTGGTGTAISVASTHNIPVFNLAREDHLVRIRKGLGI